MAPQERRKLGRGVVRRADNRQARQAQFKTEPFGLGLRAGLSRLGEVIASIDRLGVDRDAEVRQVERWGMEQSGLCAYNGRGHTTGSRFARVSSPSGRYPGGLFLCG